MEGVIGVVGAMREPRTVNSWARSSMRRGAKSKHLEHQVACSGRQLVIASKAAITNWHKVAGAGRSQVAGLRDSTFRYYFTQ
jgi:hypothetical protein